MKRSRVVGGALVDRSPGRDEPQGLLTVPVLDEIR
jgi:hypothetical protein